MYFNASIWEHQMFLIKNRPSRKSFGNVATISSNKNIFLEIRDSDEKSSNWKVVKLYSFTHLKIGLFIPFVLVFTKLQRV